LPEGSSGPRRKLQAAAPQASRIPTPLACDALSDFDCIGISLTSECDWDHSFANRVVINIGFDWLQKSRLLLNWFGIVRFFGDLPANGVRNRFFKPASQFDGWHYGTSEPNSPAQCRYDELIGRRAEQPWSKTSLLQASPESRETSRSLVAFFLARFLAGFLWWNLIFWNLENGFHPLVKVLLGFLALVIFVCFHLAPFGITIRFVLLAYLWYLKALISKNLSVQL
jgi:hypothetical protein